MFEFFILYSFGLLCLLLPNETKEERTIGYSMWAGQKLDTVMCKSRKESIVIMLKGAYLDVVMCKTRRRVQNVCIVGA